MVKSQLVQNFTILDLNQFFASRFCILFESKHWFKIYCKHTLDAFLLLANHIDASG